MSAENQIHNFFKKVKNNLENNDNNLVTYNGDYLTYRQASEKIKIGETICFRPSSDFVLFQVICQ